MTKRSPAQFFRLYERQFPWIYRSRRDGLILFLNAGNLHQWRRPFPRHWSTTEAFIDLKEGHWPRKNILNTFVQFGNALSDLSLHFVFIRMGRLHWDHGSFYSLHGGNEWRQLLEYWSDIVFFNINFGHLHIVRPPCLLKKIVLIFIQKAGQSTERFFGWVPSCFFHWLFLFSTLCPELWTQRTDWWQSLWKEICRLT